MPSYSVMTRQVKLPQQCEVTGRDMYEIEVTEMLPKKAWKHVKAWKRVKKKTLTCPFVDNIKKKYKKVVFTIQIPLQFIPDNIDGDVVKMLTRRKDIHCIRSSLNLWIDSVHVGK